MMRNPEALSSRRAGFTLVELLVVIGIIAMLISILLPSLNKARETGRRIACGSNMRQWHLAITMYVNDYKGYLPGPLIPCTFEPTQAELTRSTKYPTSTNLPDWISKSTGNPEVLWRYLGKQKAAFYCPSQSQLFSNGGCAPGTTYAGSNFGFGYKLNNQLDTWLPYYFGYWGTVTTTVDKTDFTVDGTVVKMPKKTTTRNKKLAEIRLAGITQGKLGVGIKNHSDIWMMSDIDGLNWSYNTSSTFGISLVTTDYKTRSWQPPHKSGVAGRNYLFFDGHVEWFGFGTSDADARPYNAANKLSEIDLVP